MLNKTFGVASFLLLLCLTFKLDLTNAELSNKNVAISQRFTGFENVVHGALRNRRQTKPTMLSTSNSSTTNISSSVVYCDTAVQPEFVLSQGSLVTYLLRVQLCKYTSNRSWFDEQCAQNVYAITNYYRKIYLKFCDPSTFAAVCNKGTDTRKVLSRYMAEYNVTSLSNLTAVITNYTITTTELDQEGEAIRDLHCQSIESYFDSLMIEKSSTSHNTTAELEKPFYSVSYTEWFLTFRVFCDPYACGVSQQNYKNLSLSAYECAPDYCKKNIVLSIILDSILAVVIVIANILVLSVAVKSNVMSNIPGYFKISLAFADLLVGAIVVPGCVYNHFVLSIYPLPYRKEAQKPLSTDYFDQKYLNFMGIFTVWSFAVSIYTMGFASIDRYLAVTKPFKYKQGKFLTKKRSIGVLTSIWIFGFILALYPVFGSNSQYNITGLGLVLTTGFITIMIYAITIGVPLLAVWVINLTMLTQVCSDRKNRRNLSVSRKKLSRNRQKESITMNNTQKISSVTSRKRMSDQSNQHALVGNNGKALDSNRNVSNEKNSKTHDKNFSKVSRKSSESVFQKRFLMMTNSVQTTFKKNFRRLSSSAEANQISIERRLAKTLSVMIGAFTLAILPCIVILAIQPVLILIISPQQHPLTYSPYATNLYISLEYISSRLFLSNSFWNCIIYSVRNKKFRAAAANIFAACSIKARRQRRNRIESISFNSRQRNSQISTKLSMWENSNTC